MVMAVLKIILKLGQDEMGAHLTSRRERAG